MTRTLPLLAALALAGCTDTYDNLAACESFLDGLRCTAKAAERLDCSVYEAIVECDLSDYFACLERETTCPPRGEDGEDDAFPGWSECSALATCDRRPEPQDDEDDDASASVEARPGR